MEKAAEQKYRKLRKIDLSLVDLKMEKVDRKGNSVQCVKEECLKFLALCAVAEKPLTPAVLVDEYWHQLILNTPKYALVSKVLGKFIHHIQNDGSKIAQKKDRVHFWNTIQIYEDTFGEPNLKVWGLESKRNLRKHTLG